MPLDNTLTYEQTPPRRPALDDLNGGALENHPTRPPTPTVHPDARAMNQSDKQIVALTRVTPAVGFYVTFSGGTPSINALIGAREGLVAGDFALTDNGNGDTSIVHAGGKLPIATLPAFSLTQVDDTEIDRMRIVAIANGWRVKTKLGATGTDCNFVLWVTGLG